MKNKALIVCCENNLDLSYYKDYYIVGVERGCLDLINKNLRIDMALSDFDHVLSEEFELIKDKASKVIKLSERKDYLDGEVAINHCLDQNFVDIVMIVRPSKRYDMAISVFDLIFKYSIKIISETSVMFPIKKGTNILEYERYQDYTYISLFSKIPTTVTIKNLQYNAENLILEPYSTRSMSNGFIVGKNGEINNNENLVCVISK